MAVEPNGRAPYAPPSAVLDILHRYREHGLTTPFTNDVLMRAGVTESLASRTLQALQLLDLVDTESGRPTPQLEALQRASSEEYPEALANIVRAAYADVFQFSNPASDSADRVEDAFRQYEPRGQRRRMVTLFLGLCQEAGIIESAPAPRAPRTRSRESSRGRARAAGPPTRPATQDKRGDQRLDLGSNGLPPALGGLLAQLPSASQGWTQDRRDAFVSTFEAVLDFCVPIVEESGEEEFEEEVM